MCRKSIFTFLYISLRSGLCGGDSKRPEKTEDV